MTNEWTMSAESTPMIAVTAWNRPMPPSMREREFRRAPATDAANAALARTKAERTRSEPSAAMTVGGSADGRCRRARRFVLGWALGCHVVGVKAVRAEASGQH